MITVACLQTNTPLVEYLKDYIEQLGYEGIAAGDDATGGANNVHVQTIYNQLNAAGIEVDMETVGALYNEVMPKEYSQFMSDEEVNNYSLKNFRKSARNAAMLKQETKQKRTGQEAPERAMVIGLMNMFRKTHAPDINTKTMMKTMQDVVWRAVQREVGTKVDKPKDDSDWQDMLQKYVDFKNMGVRDVDGSLNTMQDLFNSMRDVLNEGVGEMEQEIQKKGGDMATLDKFNEMVDKLNASAMTLFFSKGDAKKLFTDMFKKEGYGKTLADGTEIIDWNKLAGDTASVADLRSHVDDIMKRNGYSQDITEAVKDSMQDEFNDLHAKVIDKQLNPDTAKTMAGQATSSIMEDPSVKNFLNGITKAGNPIDKVYARPQDWIDDVGIDTVEKMEEAADKRLDDLKYQGGVRAMIKTKLKDFFEKNYARASTNEAKDAIRNILGEAAAVNPQNRAATPAAKKTGMTALEWLKKNGIQNGAELRAQLDQEIAAKYPNGLSAKTMRDVRAAMDRILNLQQRGEKELGKRVKLKEAKRPMKKTQLQRLAELNNLGVFNTQHDKLVNDLAGIDGATQQDMDDIKEIADLASKGFRELEDKFGPGGGNLHANSHFQEMQTKLNLLVQRNHDNKTKTAKILKYIKSAQDLMLFSMLAGVFNLTGNTVSNFTEVMGSKIAGGYRGSVRQNMEVFWSAVGQVMLNGQAFGTKISEFHVPNTLERFSFGIDKNKSTLNNVYHNSVALLAALPKFFLTGMDSGFKAVATNTHMNKMMYYSLTHFGGDHGTGMKPDKAKQFMNNALHGKSWEQAKVDAEKLLTSFNAKAPAHLQVKLGGLRGRVNITSLANNLVTANLVADGSVTTEVLNAMTQSAYKVAGYGLGHEANNVVSRLISGAREKMSIKEKKLTEEKKWNQRSWHRFGASMLNMSVFKFTAGAFNWLTLRAQKTGLGVVPAVWAGFQGKWQVDKAAFEDPKLMQQAFYDMQKARGQMSRAAVGFGLTVGAYMLKYFFEAMRGADDDEAKLEELTKREERLKEVQGLASDEDAKAGLKIMRERLGDEMKQYKTSSLFGLVGDKYINQKMFESFAPDLMIMHYTVDASPDTWTGATKYIEKTMGTKYMLVSRLNQIQKLQERKDYDAARGLIGTTIGERLWSVPFWRPAKASAQQLTDLFSDGPSQPRTSTDFKNPTTIMEGLIGGGALEDVGLYKRNPVITFLPGIGGTAYDKYKEKGLTTMEDFRKNPGWENMYDSYGKPILQSDEKKKAKNEFDKYAAQTWGE